MLILLRLQHARYRIVGFKFNSTAGRSINRHLAVAMKSSWFDIEVEHWRWQHRPVSYELKSDLTMAMKSSWFDIDFKHLQWPRGQIGEETINRHLARYITTMNHHLAVAMKSSWFDTEVEHRRWPQRQISLTNSSQTLPWP